MRQCHWKLKKKIIHGQYNDECTLKFTSNAGRLIMRSKNGNKLLEKEIDDFTCVNAKRSFKRRDPSNWKNNEDFNEVCNRHKY